MTHPAPGTARPARRKDFRFLLRRGWIAALAGGLLFAAACFFILAPWQYSRHHGRDALDRQITDALAAPSALLTDQLNVSAPPAADLVYHQVVFSGTYLPAAQVYVRVQQDGSGRPASEVVVPFRLDDGSLLMVDRGYALVTDLTAGRMPAPVSADRVTLTARVQTDRPDPSSRAPVREDGRLQVYGLSGPVIQAVTGVSGPLRQGHAELVDGAPGVLEPIGVPDIDSGPFLSYAWQWDTFGIMTVIGMIFFVHREATDPLDEDEEEDLRLPEPAFALPGPLERRIRRSSFDKSRLYDAE